MTNAHGRDSAELGAEPVDVVVAAAHADQLRAVDAGREQLLLLEVGGDEDVRLEPSGRGMRRDRVGQVAGRGAGDRLEAELARLGQRDGDHPVLERVGRVRGVVLDPDLAEPEPLGEPVGAQQRRQSGPQRVLRALRERQEVRVAPDVRRTRLDLALRLVGVEARVVVRDLERAEAALADVVRLERVRVAALLAAQRRGCHAMKLLPIPVVKRKRPLPVASRGPESDFHSHLPGSSPAGIGTCPRILRSSVVAGVSSGQSLHPSGCSGYVVATIATVRGALRRCGERGVPLSPSRDVRADERDEQRCRAFQSPGCAATAGELVAPSEPARAPAPSRGGPGIRPALGQHRAPDADRVRLARGAVRLPRPRPRGRPLAQPASEDRRVPGLPVHRPALPGLRPARSSG